MRLPRDLSGDDLVKALRGLGYEVTRQTGSHLRLTTLDHGEHHVTIPRHNPVNSFTMGGIVRDAGSTTDEFRRLL